MAGQFGFVATDHHGQTRHAFLVAGRRLQLGDVTLACEKPTTPLKVASVEGRTFHLADDLSSASVMPRQYVLADGTGYEIESVTPRSISVRDYPVTACDEITPTAQRCVDFL